MDKLDIKTITEANHTEIKLNDSVLVEEPVSHVASTPVMSVKIKEDVIEEPLVSVSPAIVVNSIPGSIISLPEESEVNDGLLRLVPKVSQEVEEKRKKGSEEPNLDDALKNSKLSDRQKQIVKEKFGATTVQRFASVANPIPNLDACAGGLSYFVIAASFNYFDNGVYREGIVALIIGIFLVLFKHGLPDGKLVNYIKRVVGGAMLDGYTTFLKKK